MLVMDFFMQFSGNQSPKASVFDVIYRPEKSGIYEISVFCGNIQLNGGHQFRKEVSAGTFRFCNVLIARYAAYTDY